MTNSAILGKCPLWMLIKLYLSLVDTNDRILLVRLRMGNNTSWKVSFMDVDKTIFITGGHQRYDFAMPGKPYLAHLSALQTDTPARDYPFLLIAQRRSTLTLTCPIIFEQLRCLRRATPTHSAYPK
jgi:hypothetical protein